MYPALTMGGNTNVMREERRLKEIADPQILSTKFYWYCCTKNYRYWK
jgi:hypothetical protein